MQWGYRFAGKKIRSTSKKKHICCCGGGGWDGQRWIDEGSTHLGSLAIRNILDRGRVRMLKDYSFSMKNSHSLICLASLLFSQNMNIWCILDISFPVNQRSVWRIRKGVKKEIGIFRCASISWFQVVSQSVIHAFRLAHLRGFQSYFISSSFYFYFLQEKS